MTPLQRWAAYCDALLDATATVNQRTKLAEAYVYAASAEDLVALANTDNRTGLTDTQKALVALGMALRNDRTRVRDHAATLAGIAAQASIAAARETAW